MLRVTGFFCALLLPITAEASSQEFRSSISGRVLDAQSAGVPGARVTAIQVRPFDNTGPSTFSMGGTPHRSNEILLDGAPSMNRFNEIAYTLPRMQWLRC